MIMVKVLGKQVIRREKRYTLGQALSYIALTVISKKQAHENEGLRCSLSAC
jgi:hypothetical protein